MCKIELSVKCGKKYVIKVCLELVLYLIGWVVGMWLFKLIMECSEVKLN